ncbi:ATP-binding protein [Streptomyces sp. NPDC056716]|uniref:ATP-binding protein n=1 Tax=unclassified Streptomyces TaxID=2593676 RepID=UPI0036BF5153
MGREPEVAALHQLLARHRLVTVAGAAGVGKSALARVGAEAMPGAAAPWRRMIRLRWDGDGPAEAGSLTQAALRALGEAQIETVSVAAATAGGTGKRRNRTTPTPTPTLLVLDGIDAVHGECAALVRQLLTTVPALRLLVTSRRPLGLGDERVLEAGPLAVGSPDGRPGDGPAVGLFLRRAQALTGRAFTADADLRAITAICAVLDGNPRAIELAARHTTRHPPGVLAELLTHSQCWLDTPDPEGAGNRSPRASIGAGYALCERAERTVWARTSMFAGAFAEDAAVFLCAGGGVEPERVPGSLARLSALGVLEPVEPPDGLRGPRYRMNLAAREFGAERLRAAGEFAVAAERRMVHCRNVATVADSFWNSGDQTGAARLALGGEADVKAMIRYAVAQPAHAEAALETVVHLWFWWAVYGRAEEGRAYALRLLPLCEAEGPLTVRAQVLAAWLCAPDDPRTARTLLGRAWPAAVRAGDDALIGRISHVQGVLALRAGDARTAAEHFRSAAHLVPPYAPGGPSGALSRASVAFALAGLDPRAARRSARRALATPGIRDDAWTSLVARYAGALVDHRLGRTARAWRRGHRALEGLDAGLPEPHGSVPLRRLLTQIERRRPGGTPTPMPPPRTADGAAATSAGRRER